MVDWFTTPSSEKYKYGYLGIKYARFTFKEIIIWLNIQSFIDEKETHSLSAAGYADQAIFLFLRTISARSHPENFPLINRMDLSDV